MSSTASRTPAQPRRAGSTLAAFVVGLPLAAGTVGLFRFGPGQHLSVAHYVHYPVQWALVSLFWVALGALLVKTLRLRVESAACRGDLLPRWDGKAVPVRAAADLVSSLDRQPGRIQGTYLGHRLRAVLDFLVQRKSTAGLDDQLRALADADALAQENSFGLVKFITWAMPILGFLGTVLGITAAISGLTPEVLEESIGSLTGGLAEAFDSTALALALTMTCMFFTFLVERREQGLLEEVDGFVDHHLAHRFQRDTGPAGSPVAEVSQALEGLVAQTYQQLTEQMVAGVRRALDETLAAQEQRLQGLQQQWVQGSAQLMQQLGRVTEAVAGQANVLSRIQADEANLVHLQAVLHQNLAALASASNFEEAVHSLTAAVHLLTTRAGAVSSGLPRKAS